uniref:Uncharacterized protein n=1 Tax=Tanacetum cinerariifolium TaxID=118510 RepID=A0A6L2P316_TANCI|nr:hypothetical protein [Tanacetum cinerariifolium]
MLSLRERIKFDLEAKLIGETLVLPRSLDPFFEGYIELNDLNVPLELRRDQVDDLMPTIKESEREDPNRDGERGFDYLISALVLSKAYRDGCRASRSGFPYCKKVAGAFRSLSPFFSSVRFSFLSSSYESGDYWNISLYFQRQDQQLLSGMSVKNALDIQWCELSRKELDEFLSSYSIPSEYRVILPTPTQTILDAPLGYIGLYTHFFSLANLRLSLNDFFCEIVRADKEPAVEPTTELATEPVNERVGTTIDLGGVPKDILSLFTLGVLRPALVRGSAKKERFFEASCKKESGFWFANLAHCSCQGFYNKG